MKYYNSHGSIILECQNQLHCFVKKKHGLFYHVYINMEKNALECLKYSQSMKYYSELFVKLNQQLS